MTDKDGKSREEIWTVRWEDVIVAPRVGSSVVNVPDGTRALLIVAKGKDVQVITPILDVEGYKTFLKGLLESAEIMWPELRKANREGASEVR